MQRGLRRARPLQQALPPVAERWRPDRRTAAAMDAGDGRDFLEDRAHAAAEPIDGARDLDCGHGVALDAVGARRRVLAAVAEAAVHLGCCGVLDTSLIGASLA